MHAMKFRGTITAPSFNSETPPTVQIGWALRVDNYLGIGEAGSPYPVGAEVAFAQRCFYGDVKPGDSVLVEYTGDATG